MVIHSAAVLIYQEMRHQGMDTGRYPKWRIRHAARELLRLHPCLVHQYHRKRQERRLKERNQDHATG